MLLISLVFNKKPQRSFLRTLLFSSIVLVNLIPTVAFSQAEVNLADQMELAQQVKYERENGFLGLRSFKLWQTYFYLSSYDYSEDLSKFDFDLYERITTSGRRYGLIKHKTDTITKAVFDLIHGAFQSGVVVSSNGKLGFVDTSGKLILPFEFEEIKIFDFKNGFVKKGGKYALANYNGKLLTQFVFDEAAGFSDDICLVMVGNRQGYINRLGQYIIQPQFNNGTHFFGGFARIYYDKWEQIEKGHIYQGKRSTNVSIGYTQSIPFLINKRGAKVFAGEDGDEIAISELGMALITRAFYENGDKYWRQMIIDTLGREIIGFNRNLMIGGINKNWILVWNPQTRLIGLTDLKGKEILKPSFTNISPMSFNEGKLAKAYFDKDNFMYIDKNGRCTPFDGVVCPPAE